MRLAPSVRKREGQTARAVQASARWLWCDDFHGCRFFGPDGSGVGTAIARARFAGAPDITASDFLLI
jgi:hypothetical protein